MENTSLILNGVDALSLYHKDCLFNKECTLRFVLNKYPNGHEHVKTQCTKCGYQTGASVPKTAVTPSDKVKQFNKRLYNAVYLKKLKEVYAMSGEHREIFKRLQQVKRAAKQGRLGGPRKRSKPLTR